MALTYTTLMADKSTEDSIKYFVRHSEVPSASILTNSQALIYSKLRIREMKKLVSGVYIASGASTITLPADLQDPISLWLDREYKMRLRIFDEEHFEERVARDENGDLYAGTPSQCTMDRTTAYLDVAADRDYYYRLWYYQTPAALSDSNETNFLTSRYPHILEAACKFFAFKHREDDGNASSWLEVMTGAIDLANGQHDQFQQSIQHEMYWDQR